MQPSAHEQELGIRDEYGVHHKQYRVDEDQGAILSLFEAPNKQAEETVHWESHGLIADEL